MILIVSSPEDQHTQVIMAQLHQAGAETHLLDFSSFPVQASLSMAYGAHGGPAVHTFTNGQGPVRLQDARVIWWRRPQGFTLTPEMSDYGHQAFALNECMEAFGGLWPALDVVWVNDPTRNEVGARKAYQLRVAQQVGLTIPDTLITNDPQQARAFIDRHGPAFTIYKSFSATRQNWRETRLLKPEELSLLENVRHAPVIFQEYIPAEADLRITMVGDRLFPAAIYSQESAYKVDFRMDMDSAPVEATDLPGEVASGLFRLMDRLGLVYGAIDMRRTPAGEYVFLEVNPAGQWLFIEQRTGQPITEAMATLLLHPERASLPRRTTNS